MPDFYPGNMESTATWHASFAANVGKFAAKYNITPAQLASVAADNAWVQYWVARRYAAAIFASQLASYYNSISGNDTSLDPPLTPAFELTGQPDEVPPGIEFRARELARHIRGHSVYSEADGTMLGIIGEGGGGYGLNGVIKPTIKTVAAASKYLFTVNVNMRGVSDSWQVWATVVGENKWHNLATATGRSAEIAYAPADQDNKVPYQLQIRVQLRRSNKDYGQVSQISAVTVNP